MINFIEVIISSIKHTAARKSIINSTPPSEIQIWTNEILLKGYLIVNGSFQSPKFVKDKISLKTLLCR